METFKIEVHEVLSRVVRVEAESQNDAISKVKNMYRNEEIVLDAEDYEYTEIKPFFDDASIKEILQKKDVKDDRTILSEILQLLGISKDKSNLITLEAGSSQEIVNEDYLMGIGFPSYNINNAMKYINMFYRGELCEI
jgi:hypothetical protein